MKYVPEQNCLYLCTGKHNNGQIFAQIDFWGNRNGRKQFATDYSSLINSILISFKHNIQYLFMQLIRGLKGVECGGRGEKRKF